MKQAIYILLVFVFFGQGHAQIGGDNVYEFLSLSPSARITGLGGNLITVADDDVAIAYQNPSTLNASMHRGMSFGTNFWIRETGILDGYASYAHHQESWKTTFHGGIFFINYGEFDGRDIFGTQTGGFRASEYALTLGANRQLSERLSAGTNLKVVTSSLAGFNSTGLALDLAAMYQDTASLTTLTFVLKNMGSQLTPYEGSGYEPLPFDVQLGFSKKLRYLPFRFSIIAHNLHRWNIRYDDPNSQEEGSIFGEAATEESRAGIFVDNFFRHFIFNGEFLLGKKENIRLRAGYNHLRRQELSVNELRSMSGFSLGVGFKVSHFRIDYGTSFFHLAGGVHHLTVSTNLRAFASKIH